MSSVHSHRLAQIIAAIVSKLPSVDAGELSEETNLYDMGMDSTGAVAVMLCLEEQFAVIFPESMIDEATFRSPGALCRAIDALMEGRAP